MRQSFILAAGFWGVRQTAVYCTPVSAQQTATLRPRGHRQRGRQKIGTANDPSVQ